MGLPRPVLSYDLRSDARGYELSNNQFVWMCGNIVFKDIPREMWIYDANSLSTDNGTTVIKPDSLLSTDPGRYIYQWTEQPQRKTETFSGTTNSSGNYTVTFTVAYAVAPNVQPVLIGANIKDSFILTVSTTGFTVNVQRRTDIAGLLPTYANVNGASVSVLVTQNL